MKFSENIALNSICKLKQKKLKKFLETLKDFSKNKKIKVLPTQVGLVFGKMLQKSLHVAI